MCIRTAAPVRANNEVSLRGLPERVVAEILYGLQARTREGFHTTQFQLRPLVNRIRELELPSLSVLDRDRVGQGMRGLANSPGPHGATGDPGGPHSSAAPPPRPRFRRRPAAG